MTQNRQASIKRDTLETQIELSLNLDGEGRYEVETGIGFFDHMLSLMARHGFLDLNVEVKGDLEIDDHHTVEDVGIVLGAVLKKALGDKKGIVRYGTAFVPMDESLAMVSLDISNRPFLVFEAAFPREKVGEMATELVEEFFRAVSVTAGITLHVRLMSGKNTHHMIEAIFKAFGRALGIAVSQDPRIEGVMSTKGML